MAQKNLLESWLDDPRIKKRLIGLVILIFLVVIFSQGIIDFLADWLWFDSQGYLQVFLITYGAQSLAALGGGLLFLMLALPNIYLAQRVVPPRLRPVVSFLDLPFPNRTQLQNLLKIALWVLLVLFTFLAGKAAAHYWKVILLAWKGQAFGLADPIFGQDIAYYFFSLPFYQELIVWLLVADGGITLLVALKYIQNEALIFSQERRIFYLAPKVRQHLLSLGGVFLLLLTWFFWLTRYHVLYKVHGVFIGAGYADVNGVLLVYPVVAVLALVTVGLVFSNIWRTSYRLLLAGLAATAIVALLGLNFYPALLYNFLVKPNELLKETPYIQNNLKFTRLAYNLDRVQEIEYPGRDSLTLADLATHQGTVANIKIWDKRPLMMTYKQLQEIRSYYEFPLVATDRYQVDGRLRQVMLAPRELAVRKLPVEARTWVNERLKFTHGYGACLSPVNRVTESGLPEFWLKDLPPIGRPELKLEQPQIYFGVLAHNYALVNTKTEEFDYPAGDENKYNHYQGKGGVRLNGFWQRLLMALKFKDIKIILSDYLGSDTRILWRRTITEMTHALAPFLTYEQEPYPVISQGRLYWFLDAYTLSSRYPYSTPYRSGPEGINYLRNSVKVIIDAYEGSVVFYQMDPDEPIAASWQHIYPTLFKPFGQMPEHLKMHIRYPSDLFHVQATIFRSYHMQDPQVFYNREDQWEFPSEIYEEKETSLRPYYTVMRLPQAAREEFILLMPYTANRKPNMVSWLVAKCDLPDYGKMQVYTLPKDKLIYGPMQIEARIDQDPEISSLMTLWGQKGSQVLRGQLMVVPIKDSLLYVEPLYLVATQTQMPELKKVVVVNGPRLALADTLEEALRKVFAEKGEPLRPAKTSTAEVPALDSRQALQHLRQAQEYLKAGDWISFGKEMQRLQGVLEGGSK